MIVFLGGVFSKQKLLYRRRFVFIREAEKFTKRKNRNMLKYLVKSMV